MLLCPTCQMNLIRRTSKLGFFWVCRTCRGRAIAVEVLRKVIPRKVLNSLWQTARSQQNSGDRQCPGCSRPMTEVALVAGSLSEQVDVCTQCYFVWFDRGEFENLPKEANQSIGTKSLPYEATEVLAKVRLEALRKEQEYDELVEQSGPDHWWQAFLGVFGVPIVYNDAPRRHRPIVTWSLAVIIAAVSIAAFRDLDSVILEWALIPGWASRRFGLTLVTSFFLHAGPVHLLVNLAFLIVFGGYTEDFLGKGQYLLLIAAAAIAGASAHILTSFGSAVPCIGASGGISGIMAYYCLRFPKTSIGFLHWFRWFRVRADFMLVVWLLAQTIIAFEASVGLSMIAAFAHLGGAAVGVLFWLATRQSLRQTDEAGISATK